MKIRKGTVLFYDPDISLGIDGAREYIKRFSLTNDNVKILKRDNSVTVEAKKDTRLERDKYSADDSAGVLDGGSSF